MHLVHSDDLIDPLLKHDRIEGRTPLPRQRHPLQEIRYNSIVLRIPQQFQQFVFFSRRQPVLEPLLQQIGNPLFHIFQPVVDGRLLQDNAGNRSSYSFLKFLLSF
jgi:hypothetical protein